MTFWYGLFVVAIAALFFLFLFSNKTERQKIKDGIKKWYLPEPTVNTEPSHGSLPRLFYRKFSRLRKSLRRLRTATEKTILKYRRKIRAQLFTLRGSQASNEHSFIKKVKDESNTMQSLA
jgi:hypothetical protein